MSREIEFLDPPLPILRKRFRPATEPNARGLDVRETANPPASAAAEPRQLALAGSGHDGVGYCHACGAKLGASPACWNCGAFNRGVGAYYVPPVSVGGILDITDEHSGPLAPGAFVDSCLRGLADDIDRDNSFGSRKPKPDSGGLFIGFLCALGTVVLIASAFKFFGC